MSTVNVGWLKDKNGEKFAPKTLISQITTSDGTTLEVKLNTELEENLADSKAYTDTLKNGQVTINKNNIAANVRNITTNTENIEKNATNINTNTTDISGLKTRVDETENTLQVHTANLESNTSKINTLETNMSALIECTNEEIIGLFNL